MKLVTFINLSHANLAYNLYLQLKKVNLHKNLVIYTPSDNAIQYLEKLNIECDIQKYTPVLFKDCFNDFIWSDDHVRCSHGNNAYTTFQFIKHDCVYQLLQHNKYVCLLDADMMIFSNFVDDLKELLDSQKFGIVGTSSFAFKYYLNINVTVDNPDNKYGWGGKHTIINTGFMTTHQSDYTLQTIENYSKLFIPYFGNHSGNVDEHILTKYFSNGSFDANICSIPDSINTLSDCGNIYTSNKIKKLKCHTFHPTFVGGDKIEFMKECDQWFVKDNTI